MASAPIVRSLFVVIGLSYFPCAASPTAAAEPRIAFDVAPLVACRDVTSPEFAEAHPGERLVEAKLSITAMLDRGNEGDLIEYRYRMESPDDSMPVVDYAPQTLLASETAGPVTIEKRDDRTRQLGLTLSGPHELPVRIAGAGDIAGKSSDLTRYELVPEMEAIVASGTFRRGYGVIFKLRPSRGTTLEGAKEFAFVFRVPQSWRGGYVQLDCQAVGVHRGVIQPLNERIIAGRSRFNVALYQAGDPDAQHAARRLVRAEYEFLNTVSSKQREIERRSYPTWAHKVGKFLDVVEPKIPAEWAEEVVFGTSPRALAGVANHLPIPVRQAAVEYVIARRRLVELDHGVHIHLE